MGGIARGGQCGHGCQYLGEVLVRRIEVQARQAGKRVAARPDAIVRAGAGGQFEDMQLGRRSGEVLEPLGQCGQRRGQHLSVAGGRDRALQRFVGVGVGDGSPVVRHGRASINAVAWLYAAGYRPSVGSISAAAANRCFARTSPPDGSSGERIHIMPSS